MVLSSLATGYILYQVYCFVRGRILARNLKRDMEEEKIRIRALRAVKYVVLHPDGWPGLGHVDIATLSLSEEVFWDLTQDEAQGAPDVDGERLVEIGF
eukprot:CAMPEP_0196574844 /NCGR_PEP_ID=MMETSP1081-20130531/4466_1 /TAXON_ID=36882 /ORGANISM="Pyramimonas amylifera, Strain CCMP720" /LENGTH=97 /DNA_ID=CAMNT_0041892977 /DNA_START=552 /DNA_END=845 /DNA_ORIENTATION=-